MTSETSGILDGNALFADLPFASAPPMRTAPTAHHRRYETTARTNRPAHPADARLIAVIICGSVALAASLVACFLYAAG